jgi:hypothetical protein
LGRQILSGFEKVYDEIVLDTEAFCDGVQTGYKDGDLKHE